MSNALAGATALWGLALYAGHHVGDYWVQTDHQAQHKGNEGHEGIRACVAHVATYTLTQAVCLGMAAAATGARWNLWAFLAGLTVSAVTHYLADRREFGIMFRLARMLPGKARFLTLGVPRKGARWMEDPEHASEPAHYSYDDNPSLGTGAWALDQSWHLFWGVFVAALVIGGLS
jgi:hypothetical protein